MINLALRTEYSFKQCYGFINNITKNANNSVGIADENNTFGHFQLQKVCKTKHIKPIFGVRLMVGETYVDKQKTWGPKYIFLAVNDSGLSEIYALVKRAYDRFYYHPFLIIDDIKNLTKDVIVIAPNFVKPDRVDYIGLCHLTPPHLANHSLPKVAINLNWFTNAEDRQVYELHAGARMSETQTYPQHILSEDEWFQIWGDKEAIHNTYVIADKCNAKIPVAPMVKYTGKLTLHSLCAQGARNHNISLNESPYKERIEKELKLIEEKNFTDYFLIVAEMVRHAKRRMLVGPSRGSSAGSLVCFLTGITEVDPIKFDLLFERFIDINRDDLPDIDIDFPDVKRKLVIKTLVETYGENKVSHVGTVSTLKPRSAIGNFAKGLGIASYETDEIKDAIADSFKGDAGALTRISDTFELTEIGKAFIKKFPSMEVVKQIEGHASHAGVHAAGIVVSNENLTSYGGINSRDGVMMLDKDEIEGLGLLKIDCLGLRTLSVLESVADQIGMPYKNYYSLPLDDKKALNIFNSMRLSGIFQFQGSALQFITRQMGVHSFDDLAAITSLARPGPMQSGGTNLFIARRTGKEPVEYLSEHPSVIKHTKATYGVIVYQEQLMYIAREYGKLSWNDVSSLRKAISKSFGSEQLESYRNKFVSGAIQNGIDTVEANNIWENIVTFGKYGFNKSHAYGYALISYWTAWAKAYYPLEFAVANLNNAGDEKLALKILRDMVTNDKIEYVAFDPDESEIKWSVKNGKLLGGLISLKGIGLTKARKVIKARSGKEKWTPALVRMMRKPNTIFDILFPCQHYWGELFTNPTEYGLTDAPTTISEIGKAGSYLFVGKLTEMNIRDLNEIQSVARRGGEVLTTDTLFLNMTVEDDTDSIRCTINRYRFELKGRKLTESAIVDESWFLIKGDVKDGWRQVDVREILLLNDWKPENMLRPAHNLK